MLRLLSLFHSMRYLHLQNRIENHVHTTKGISILLYINLPKKPYPEIPLKRRHAELCVSDAAGTMRYLYNFTLSIQHRYRAHESDQILVSRKLDGVRPFDDLECAHNQNER